MLPAVVRIPRRNREQGGTHVNGILHTVRLVSNTVAVIAAYSFDWHWKGAKLVCNSLVTFLMGGYGRRTRQLLLIALR